MIKWHFSYRKLLNDGMGANDTFGFKGKERKVSLGPQSVLPFQPTSRLVGLGAYIERS